MSFPCWFSPLRRVSFLGAAILLAASMASAQSSSAQAPAASASFSPAMESSSLQSPAALNLAALDPDAAALPAAPAPAASAGGAAAAGQEYGGGGGWKHYVGSRLAFEAGGGFNAPVGNDTPFITWGGNFTVGGGVRFSKRLSALFEYQFMGDKLPGPFLAAYGVQAGNSHINSLTGSPVLDLFPKKSNGVYLVGGWGYYHKSTNLQDYEEEESFYGIYDEPVTVASVTSNQWGGNAGLGIYHRLGGMYGDSHTQLFAEARYTFIHTPPPSASNGFGTTELIPVTLGVRF